MKGGESIEEATCSFGCFGFLDDRYGDGRGRLESRSQVDRKGLDDGQAVVQADGKVRKNRIQADGEVDRKAGRQTGSQDLG